MIPCARQGQQRLKLPRLGKRPETTNRTSAQPRAESSSRATAARQVILQTLTADALPDRTRNKYRYSPWNWSSGGIPSSHPPKFDGPLSSAETDKFSRSSLGKPSAFFLIFNSTCQSQFLSFTAPGRKSKRRTEKAYVGSGRRRHRREQCIGGHATGLAKSTGLYKGKDCCMSDHRRNVPHRRRISVASAPSR